MTADPLAIYSSTARSRDCEKTLLRAAEKSPTQHSKQTRTKGRSFSAVREDENEVDEEDVNEEDVEAAEAVFAYFCEKNGMN
jgi:hypothetical protein